VPLIEADDRFQRAIAAIDRANADDPNQLMVRGTLRPKELAHAELMTEWVHRLVAEPSVELLLAARAHHIRRWIVPRSSYPDGRAGYLRWRTDLHKRHAADVGEILTDAGYGADVVGRVQNIVRKRNLARDPEVQVLEDALCLVFLETQLGDLAAKLDREKSVDVLRKTAAKMSDAGRQAAFALELAPGERALLQEALG
jgi:hypothetical protein